MAARCGIVRRDSYPEFYCPGGAYEYSGNMDPSLCAGAPVYQHGGADGPVLFRYDTRGGSTFWQVGDSSALGDCVGSVSLYLASGNNDQPGGGPPTAAAYGENQRSHDWFLQHGNARADER